MANLVAYYRVSTQRQGDSGLGLDAQESLVKRYATNAGHTITATFIEVESGTKNERPQLSAALAAAKATGATLAVAKLDRLGRNAAFLLALLDAGTEVVFCDQPHINRLTIGILAVVAEHEAKMISERTKAALQAARGRGQKLGFANPSRGGQAAQAAALAGANRIQTADAHATKVAPRIYTLRGRGLTLQQVADELNEGSIATARGGRWHATTVANVLKRLAA